MPRRVKEIGAGIKDRKMKLNEPKYKITRDESHAYSVEHNGKAVILPGVTGILDTVGSKDKVNRLMGWAKKSCLLKVAEHLRPLIGKAVTIDDAWIEAVRKSAWKRDKELLKEAGDLGTLVHAAIDAHIDGKAPILDDKTRPGYENFCHWLKDSGIELIKGDTYVAKIGPEADPGNYPYGFGGALDAVGMRGDRLVILDWKTSNSLQDTYALQVAAYCMAFQETYGHGADEAYVVRFGKETPGDIEIKKVDIFKAWAAFDFALNLRYSMSLGVWS